MNAVRQVSMIAALREAALRKAASENPADYCRYVLEVEPARHHTLMLNELNSVIEQMLKGRSAMRLMILAPPGSAKSTYTSHGFASYAMGKLPAGYNIAVGTHTDGFSKSWSRKVRNTCRSRRHLNVFPNSGVSKDHAAVQEWSTLDNKEFFGKGVGGTITGKRVDLLILDDLIKGEKAANSKADRRTVIDWYLTDVYTRLKPGASIVIVNTRWHEEDLPGYLIEQMENGVGEPWKILKLQAICTDPETDPMKRNVGEVLWPEWQPIEEILRIRDKSGMSTRVFDCLYQQEPKSKEGSVALRKWFLTYTNEEFNTALSHPRSRIYISIDTADTKDARNDPTVALAFLEHEGRSYLIKEYRERKEFHELSKDIKMLIRDITLKYKRPSAILVEGKGGGLAIISDLKTGVTIPVIKINPNEIGDKEFRFDKATPYIESGSLLVPDKDAPWLDAYLDELTTFPASRNDDRVDSTSQYINYIQNKPKKRRSTGRRTAHG